MIFRLFVAVSLTCFVIAASGYIYFRGFSPDRETYPIRGIDVSHHQGEIDWKCVASDDVTFAYIKATEGGDHKDRLFQSNLAAAMSAGIAVGAYHFFTFCSPGAKQARNFIDSVPHDQPMLPPVIDIEFGGNCSRRPTVDELKVELSDFIVSVEAEFGKPATIYLIGDAVDAYAKAVPSRQRWVRSLAWHPGDEDWIYWQYHNRGSVDGIVGNVDLNVFRGELPDLAKLIVRKDATGR